MPGLDQSFAADRPFLWGLCYRMTGSAIDADDLVQDTYVRALASPPPDTRQPWRPWLARVAMNLSRDHLRRRRRRSYVGPWLPTPIGDDADAVPAVEAVVDGQSTEGRYDLLESVSFAFLVALEELTPMQRAVLLLRDVFDYTVEQTADLLSVSPGNVKTTLHRSRRKMAAYDRDRWRGGAASLGDHTREALGRFLECLQAQDNLGIERLLSEDVVSLSDGGGEFFAALNPVRGASNIARFFVGILSRRSADGRGPDLRTSIETINGLPAIVTDFIAPPPRFAPRVVLSCRLDDRGRIAAMYSVLATAKLAAIRRVQSPTS